MVNPEILARKTETGDIVTSSVVLSREASESKLIGPTPTPPLMLSFCFIQNGYCHFDSKVGAKLSSYVNVTSGDLNALKIAIFQNGPVSVGIDASHRSFAFYSFGVYYEPKCGM